MNFYSDISDRIDFNKWNHFINVRNSTNAFQTFSMYHFWKNQKNYSPFIFFIESNKNECLAFCTGVIICNGNGIKKMISRRAIIYGEPVINENSDKIKVLDFLIKNIEKKLRFKSVYTEIRNFQSNESLKNIYKINKWEYIPYQNYLIKLDNEEEVFKQFNSEKRRQIRKSLKEGVEFSYQVSEENIKGVYDVLYYIYKTRVKKPLPNFNFFKNLLKTNGAGLVALILNKKVIGGGFFLKDKDTIYDWYRGGLDHQYKKHYPSTTAAWAVMQYGLNNGLKVFDFMGAGIKGQEYGVRKFKSQFGGKLIENGRYLKVNNRGLYKVGLLGMEILKKIK